MLGLIARDADLWNGWLVHSRSHPGEVAPLIAALDAACVAEGRDPASIGRTLGIKLDQRPEGERTPMANPSVAPLSGTNEQIVDALRSFPDQGFSHLQIVPVIQGVAGIEALAPVLRLLDRNEPASLVSFSDW